MKYLFIILLIVFNFQAVTYLTAQSSSDGFGSQMQIILAGLAIAESLGLEFVYSPIGACEHNYNQDPNYIKNLNEFVGLSNFFKIMNDFPHNKRHKINSLPSIRYEDGILNILDHNALYIVNRNINLWKKVKDKYRKIYLATPKPQLKAFDLKKKNVAVHIRRKNIKDNRETLLPDRYYFRIMGLILAKYSNVVFHIYSQSDPNICINNANTGNFGDYKKFTEQRKCDIVFHLDESIEETFHGMVMADALITCDSALSCMAARVSEGDIYYHKFFCSPMPGWKVFI